MRTYTLEVTKLGQPPYVRTINALNEMDALHKVRGEQFPSTSRARVIGLFELDGTPVTLPGRDFTPAEPKPVRHMTKRQARQPVKGQRCPANRTAKAHDPKVKLLPQKSLGERTGLRDCGKCGKPDVPVFQSVDRNGYPLAAWYYGRHEAE